MKRIIAAACFALLSACATYTTQAAGVSLAAIAEKDSDIANAFSREAAMVFPAHLAIARVAASGYASRANVGYGSGGFSVLTVATSKPTAPSSVSPTCRKSPASPRSAVSSCPPISRASATCASPPPS